MEQEKENPILKLREYQNALSYAEKLYEYADILTENPAVLAVTGKAYYGEIADEAFKLVEKLHHEVIKMEKEFKITLDKSLNLMIQ